MRRDDDNASAIAEKLLQGWTMLAEYCPVEGCTTPLMRSRENKVFCVAHNMFVMSAEEAEAMKREGKGLDGTTAPAAPSSHEQEVFEESEPPGVESLDDDFYNKLRAGSDVGAGAGVSLSRKISSAAAASSGTRAAFAAPANGARTTEDPREAPRSAFEPAIAATDYMKNYADQIRAFIPAESYCVLGTDGYGRSDSRENLRTHFEINRHYVVVATLNELAKRGDIEKSTVAEAISKFGIDTNKPNPLFS